MSSYDLRLLLQNLFNAPWPKEFNATAFILPNGDAETITDAKEIGYHNFSSKDQELEKLADALVIENESLRGSPFHKTYLHPIWEILCLKFGTVHYSPILHAI
jgi:hypothetical protein